MLNAIFRSIFGTKHERDVKRMRPIVAEIEALEPALKALTDDALRAKTAEFRQRLADGAELDDLLPEAFAAAREAARRTVRMRHFDVQMMGGMVLHSGKIAEMATGEGKTLVATLPAYLNALPGLGTHVVTVNDYLARRAVDGTDLPRPRAHRRGDPARGPVRLRPGLRLPGHPARRPAAGQPAGGVRGRHHLRHQQRVRLRLPARQHA